jgi:hypothetical protein
MVIWFPRFLGKWQAGDGGWYDYRYVPLVDRKLLMAPWEPVAIFAGLVASALLLQEGHYGFLISVSASAGMLFLVARRSQRVCNGYSLVIKWSGQKRRDVRRSAEWKRSLAIASLQHLAPISWRCFKTQFIKFLRLIWHSCCRFAGFRHDDVGKLYPYAQCPDMLNPGQTRRCIIVPWEAALMLAVAIWAASSVELSLTAWSDMISPLWKAIWRSWFALPIVFLVAHRQLARMKSGKEKRITLRQEEITLRQEEMKRLWKKMYLP